MCSIPSFSSRLEMVTSYGSNGLMLNSVNATADVRQGRRKKGARKTKRNIKSLKFNDKVILF